MNTRKLTTALIALPALLFCVAAAASEFPIDTGGIPVRSETTSSGSTSNADCPQTSSATGGQGSRVTTDLTGDPQRDDSTATSVADDSSPASKETATRSGGSSGNLSAPKIRSNRWQSLVPGAIK